jgi:hypothetical protein
VNSIQKRRDAVIRALNRYDVDFDPPNDERSAFMISVGGAKRVAATLYQAEWYVVGLKAAGDVAKSWENTIPPTDAEVRSALWFLYATFPPDLRRELPEEVIDVCDRNWKMNEMSQAERRLTIRPEG